jgi:hypothetical protein
MISAAQNKNRPSIQDGAVLVLTNLLNSSGFITLKSQFMESTFHKINRVLGFQSI